MTSLYLRGLSIMKMRSYLFPYHHEIKMVIYLTILEISIAPIARFPMDVLRYIKSGSAFFCKGDYNIVKK